MDLGGIVLALGAGLLVTILATLLLPPRWGHLRPLVAAGLGFAVAYGLSKLLPVMGQQ